MMNLLQKVLPGVLAILKESPSAHAYVEYVADLYEVLSVDELYAFLAIERVCLGDGAMQARELILSTLKVCPECNGEGFVSNGDHYSQSSHSESRCESCDGTGLRMTPEEISRLYVKARLIVEEYHEDCE